MILQVWFLLISALVQRAIVFKLPRDAIYAARCLRRIRDLHHASFAYRHHEVTRMLIVSLALQVELEARNVIANIEEIAVLFHELLTSDASDRCTTDSITLFAEIVLSDTPPPSQRTSPLSR